MRDPEALTLKQKMTALKYVKNGFNKTGAVFSIYNTKSRRNANQIADNLFKKPKMQREVNKLLEKAGLTDETIANKWNDAVATGWGEKATHKDALKALEVVSKIKGWIGKETARVETDEGRMIKALTFKELKKKYMSQMKLAKQFMGEAEEGQVLE